MIDNSSEVKPSGEVPANQTIEGQVPGTVSAATDSKETLINNNSSTSSDISNQVGRIQDELKVIAENPRTKAEILVDRLGLNRFGNSPTGHEERRHEADGNYDYIANDSVAGDRIGKSSAWRQDSNRLPSDKGGPGKRKRHKI